MLSNKNAKQIVEQYWAKRFQFSPEEYQNPITLIRRETELNNSDKLFLYRFNTLSVLRISENLAQKLELPITNRIDGESLTVDSIINLARPHCELISSSTLLDHFLYPDHFSPKQVPAPFSLRQLDGKKDDALLKAYYATCTEEELDEADIDFDEADPIIFGLFDGDQMAAYASHRYWENVIADIGVLIHPQYRSRGLGKAIASVISNWCLQNNIVPMYRVFSYHQHSIQIAQSLGFKLFVSIDTLKSNQA